MSDNNRYRGAYSVQQLQRVFRFIIQNEMDGLDVTTTDISNQMDVTVTMGKYSSFLARNIQLYMNVYNDIVEQRGLQQKKLSDVDLQLIKENLKYKKQTQRFQDTNRLQRKSFRDYARVDNAYTQFEQQILDKLQNYPLDGFLQTFEASVIQSQDQQQVFGIIQLSDLHLNELIDQVYNKYDFQIAAKRLKKLAIRAKTHLLNIGIKKVLVAMTGDMINSDRRIEQMMLAAKNRTDAAFLGVYLIEQFIYDLLQDFDLVYITAVCGNESRIPNETTFSSKIVSDNYDAMIFNMLRYLFGNKTDRIIFLPPNN